MNAATLTAPAVGTTLWPHQVEAVEAALQHDGFMLAIGMGGGKSATAIEIAERTNVGKMLVVSPKSVVGVWPHQIREHGRRDWHIWSGAVTSAHGKPLANPSIPRRAEALIQATSHAAILGQPLAAVINFESAWRNQMDALLLATQWDLVVIDESHRIKSPSGKASKFLARLGERVRARGGRVLALTGTPMPHSPLDLWGQMRAIDGGDRLGTNYFQFCKRFGAPEDIYVAGGVQRTVYRGIRDDRLDDFTGRVAPVMYQVDQETLDASLGLPETVDLHRSCDLQPETRRVYDELEKDLISDVKGNIVTAANAMVLTTRLAQISGGFSKDEDGRLVHVAEPPEKAQLLEDLLQDLDPAEPVVVFCRFHADLDAVQAVCDRLGRRYGELSGRRRDGLTADATMSDGIEVLGAQLQAGGVGIDLVRARYCVFYSLDFRLAEYAQSRKRVHRPGQTRRTTYIHLLANDTIDWAVWGALRNRQDVVDAVMRRLRGDTHDSSTTQRSTP